MPKIPLPIANGFYVSDSLPISAQQCVNWYPNIVQAPALSQETLFGTPGIVELTTTGAQKQANRGADVKNGSPYFVNGNGLYRVDVTGVTYTNVFLGTVTGTGRVSMANNGTQLVILVPGGDCFVYNEDAGTPFQQVVDVDFTANGNPQHVAFIDGFFVFTTDSKKFIVSAINDALSYNALDFGSAEADPDEVVVPVVLRNQLYICGRTTIEGFQNVGGADFPFQRTGLFLSKGVDAAFSVVVSSDTVFFIGAGENESPAIYAMNGSGVQRISTTAIDSLLHSATQDEITAAFSWSYAQKGAYFVGFSFGETTLVFDTVTNRWHERTSTYVQAGQRVTTKYRVSTVVEAYGVTMSGDGVDGRIGQIDTDTYSEYDNDIMRVISTQPFDGQGNAVFCSSLELTMESGVGNAESPDPQIGMSRSLDGKTWKDERYRPIGKIGDYNHRVVWRRLGRAARFESFRFVMSDRVKPVIIRLIADVRGGYK